MNIQFNNQEVCEIILHNICKMIYRRGLIESYEKSYEDLKQISFKNRIYSILLTDNTEIKIIMYNTLHTNINSTIESVLNNNEIKKIVILNDTTKKNIKQIVKDPKNTEVFLEYEMMEDIIENNFVPEHKIITKDEKEEILRKFNDREFPKIFRSDMMCRYYDGKVGDIFKITRSSLFAGYSIGYRRVVKSPLMYKSLLE